MFDLGRTQLQARSDGQIRTTCEIDKLDAARSVSGHYHQTYPAYGCFTTSSCAHDTVATIRVRSRQKGRFSGTHAILTVERSLPEVNDAFELLGLDEISNRELPSGKGAERTEDYESSFVNREVRGV